VAPLPPQPPTQPRDVVRRAEPTGTGVIRGRVIAADTGNPVKRANVNLSPIAPLTPPPGRGTSNTANPTPIATTTIASPQQLLHMQSAMARPRQATTDAQGAFEFTGLPAGSYRLSASGSQYSGQYLGMAYGAKKPSGPYSNDPGQPIQLSSGQ